MKYFLLLILSVFFVCAQDKDFPYLDFSTCEENYRDPVLVKVLKKQGQWVTKVGSWKHQTVSRSVQGLSVSSVAGEGFVHCLMLLDESNNESNKCSWFVISSEQTT